MSEVADSAEKGLPDTLGVSSVVRLRRALFDHPEGDTGMVIGQASNGRFRYRIMFPGDPLAYSLTAHDVEVVNDFGVVASWTDPTRVTPPERTEP